MNTIIAALAFLAMTGAAVAQSTYDQVQAYQLEQRMRRIEDQQHRDRLKRDYQQKIDGSLDRYQEQTQRDGRLANPYEVPRYDLYQPSRRP